MARYLDRIVARFKRQEAKGISKYGQILEDNPRGLLEALEYAAEEVTDLLMYLEEAVEKAKVIEQFKTEAMQSFDELGLVLKERDNKLVALCEENDLQRAAIQNLSCQVVGLREGVGE